MRDIEDCGDYSATIRVIDYIATRGDRHRAIVLHPDMVEKLIDELELHRGYRPKLTPAPGRDQIMGKAIVTSKDIPADAMMMADPE